MFVFHCALYEYAYLCVFMPLICVLVSACCIFSLIVKHLLHKFPIIVMIRPCQSLAFYGNIKISEHALKKVEMLKLDAVTSVRKEKQAE